MSNKSEAEQQPVSISIPRQAEYIGLCRLLAGVVGTRGSMNAEDVADLKLAVTEACTCFLWGSEGGGVEDPEDRADDPSEALSVEFRVEMDGWEVSVSDPDHRHRIPGDAEGALSGPGGLGLTIMRALADHVEHTYTEAEGSVIRMSKRITDLAGHAG